MVITEQKLDFWIENRLNVLFKGRHGTGKSTIILDAFAKAGLKYLYFSASTLDPWVDFIGVPKEKTLENGQVVLDLVRPAHFQNDEIEAIFIDEFNRGVKKIRNAVMELIQFKSINGKKFNNLKIVWAAINPEEEGDYDVDKLDPAQKDRFHIHVDMPDDPSTEYFQKTYGEFQAKCAMNWWKELPAEEKVKVSPRRLDYAVHVFNLQGDMRDVLPVSSNVNKLIQYLQNGPILDKINSFHKNKDSAGAKEFLARDNNYTAARKYIFEPGMVEFYAPLISKEQFSTEITQNVSFKNYVIKNAKEFKQNIQEIIEANTGNPNLIKELKRRLASFYPNTDGIMPNDASLKSLWNDGNPNIPNTHIKRKVYSDIDILLKDQIPDKETAVISLKFIAQILESSVVGQHRFYNNLQNNIDKCSMYLVNQCNMKPEDINRELGKYIGFLKKSPNVTLSF